MARVCTGIRARQMLLLVVRPVDDHVVDNTAEYVSRCGDVKAARCGCPKGDFSAWRDNPGERRTTSSHGLDAIHHLAVML